MSVLSSPHFLRTVLWIDAIASLASGALQIAVPGALSEWLGLPAALLAYTGEFLLLYGLAVAFLATRSQPPAALIWMLVIGNAMWGVAAVLLLVAGGLSPTWMGTGYVVLQAVFVALMAELQYFGLRRVQPAW